MRLLIFADPNDPTARACVEGLSLLGHKAIYRNPAYAKADEVETCDMMVVDLRAGGRRALNCYAASGIPAICIAEAIPMRAPHVCLTLDCWDGIVPVACPDDRRDRMRLMDRIEAKIDTEADTVTLLIDGLPYAELDGGESVESVASRIAYSMWGREEISAGAPFDFIFDVMAGNPQVEEVIKESLTTEDEETMFAHGGIAPALEPQLVGEIPNETTVSITPRIPAQPPAAKPKPKRRTRR